MNLKNCNRTKWLTKEVFIWSLFDFANSSYAIIVVAFVYSIYFKKIVAGGLPIADFYWSTSINISMAVVAVLSPILGASADHYNTKKKYLFVFSFFCIISTGLLFYVKEGMILFGMILFIFSNIGFQSALCFYDAFIKEISEPENYNKVSSLGYAIGYIGSLFSLVPVFIFQDNPRFSFLACSVIFFIFCLPFFFLVKEQKVQFSDDRKFDTIKVGIKRVTGTLKNLKSYKNLRRFFISYFIYIDGVNTIIFFSAIFALTTLNYTIAELVVFFVIVQITAMAGSFFFGYIADWIGIRKALELILIGWTVLTIAVFFVNSKLFYNIIGGVAGLFLGSSQALSRSLMTMLTPNDKKTEFFGFYSLFEKTSTIIGPLTFGLISWLSGNQRYGVAAITLYFIVGFFLLRKVEVNEKEKPQPESGFSSI